MGPGFGPWGGTGSHMLHATVKILHATVKIKDPQLCSQDPVQPNKYYFKQINNKDIKTF